MNASYAMVVAAAVFVMVAFGAWGDGMARGIAGDTQGARAPSSMATSREAGLVSTLSHAGESLRATTAGVSSRLRTLSPRARRAAQAESAAAEATFHAAESARVVPSAGVQASAHDLEALHHLRRESADLARGAAELAEGEALRLANELLKLDEPLRSWRDPRVRSQALPWLAQNAELPLVRRLVRHYIARNIRGLLTLGKSGDVGGAPEMLIDLLHDGFLSASVESRIRVLTPAWDGGAPDAVALNALRELGPGYVKLGQVLISQPDLLPSEAVARLEGVLDQLPARMTAEEFRGEVRRSLAASGSQLTLNSVDEAPLGVGSMGQVHRGVFNGEEVAIKVIAPGSEARLIENLDTMKRSLEGKGEEGELLAALIDGIRAISAQEADLRIEADSMRRAAALAPYGTRVPGVRYADRNVLIMEVAKGRRVDQVALAPRERARAARKLIVNVLDSIARQGFFHGDLHSGNIFFDTETATRWTIDWGITDEITGRERLNLLRLVHAVRKGDPAKVAQVIERMDVQGSASTSAIRRAADDALAAKGDTVEQVKTALFAAKREGVPVPSSIFLAAKSLHQAINVAKTLAPDMSMPRALAAYPSYIAREGADAATAYVGRQTRGPRSGLGRLIRRAWRRVTAQGAESAPVSVATP